MTPGCSGGRIEVAEWQDVREDSGGQTLTLSRRTRRAATGRTRSLAGARPRWDRRPESGRGGSPPAEDRERVRWGEVSVGARGAAEWPRPRSGR